MAVVLDEVSESTGTEASSALLEGEPFARAVDRAVLDLPPTTTAPNALLHGESFARAVDAALRAPQP